MPEPIDPYDALLRERIVVLGSALDDAAAADVVAQLVMLERQDDAREVSLYLNSPGGSYEAFSAVHDAVRQLGPEVETVCFGRAEGTAAVLLAAGTPGRRLVLPGAQVVLRRPEWQGELRGRAGELEFQAARLERSRERVTALLAEYTGRAADRVNADLERPYPLDAAGAVAYGLADRIAVRPRPVPPLRAV
jgi:ATP-dependent Clp protease, protease subunit